MQRLTSLVISVAVSVALLSTIHAAPALTAPSASLSLSTSPIHGRPLVGSGRQRKLQQQVRERRARRSAPLMTTRAYSGDGHPSDDADDAEDADDVDEEVQQLQVPTSTAMWNEYYGHDAFRPDTGDAASPYGYRWLYAEDTLLASEVRVRNGWAPDRRADAWRRLLDRDYHTPLTRISGVSLLRSARMHDTDRRALPYATSHIEATPEFFVCAQGVLERLGEHPGGVQPWIARDWLVQNCVGRVRGSWRWMVTCERHQGYNPLVCDQRKFELDVERMVREVFPHLGHWEGLDDVQEAEDDAAAVGSMDIPEDIMNEVTGHSRGEANYNSHDEDEDDVDDYYTANMNHVANVLTTDYVIVPWDEHEGILLPSPPFCIRNRLDPIVCDEKWRFTWRAMVDESDGDVLH